MNSSLPFGASAQTTRLASALLFVSAFVLGGFFVSVPATQAAGNVTISAATGAESVSIDTTSAGGGSGDFTELSGPALTETDAGGISAGSHTISLSSGWEFDTSSPITVTKFGSNLTPSTQTVTPSSNSFTFIVTSASTNSGATLGFSGLKVRPTGIAPSGGNMTYSAGAGIAGVTGSTNFGTLSTVAGTVAKLAFTTEPGNAVYGSTLSQQPVVQTQDQFGNLSTSGLGSATVTLTLPAEDGNLLGTAEVDISSGTAIFTDLTVDEFGTGKQLTANASGLTSAVSGSFDITQKTLTATITADDKPYNGEVSATFSNPTITNPAFSDVLTLSGGSATFADSNANTGKTVTATGLTLSGDNAGNYIYNGTAVGTADITQRPITVTADPKSKTYGEDDSAFTYQITAGSLVEGDELTGSLSRDAGENVGVHSITQGDLDNSNYGITFVSANLTIAQRPITVTATGINKEYDGNATATVTLSSDKISGDDVTPSYTSASFSDKTAANGKTVTASGITIGGTKAGNYSLQNTEAGTTVNITKRPVTVTVDVQNKVYTGTTNAAFDSATHVVNGFVPGDEITATGGSKSFLDKNVGNNKPVPVTNIVFSGADKDNYSFDGTATGAADITQRSITVTAVTGTKIYDGTTSSVGVPVVSVSTIAAGDTANFIQTYDDKNVGTNKTLIPSGTVNDGNSGANYAVTLASISSGEITPAPLTATVTVSNKVIDGNTSATITGRALVGVISPDAVTINADGAATFANASVGTHTVSATNITLAGADIGNYSYDGTATGTGNILPVPTVVYVDDNWAGTEVWTDPTDGDGPATFFGYDAFATIQEAIDAVEVGGTVNVLAGNYTEDLIINATKTNLKLAGADKTTPFIKGVATVLAASWPLADPNIEVLASGVKIHGFTIQSPDYVNGYYSSGIVIGAPNVEIHDNNFQTNAVNSTDDISQTIQTYAEAAMPSVDVSGLNIHSNTFVHQGTGNWGYEGIYINPQNAPVGIVTIQENQFTGKILRAITSERSKTTIAENTIVTDQIPSNLSVAGSWRGVQISNAAESDVLISGNTITGSSPTNGFYQGILVKSAGGVTISEKNVLSGNTIAVQNDDAGNTLDAIQNYWGTAVAATIDAMTIGDINFAPYYIDSGMTILSDTPVTSIYVDDDYSDGSAGVHYFGYDAFATIKDAIDAATAGDTISVAAGTYAENVAINGKDNLTINGVGETTVVEPASGIGFAVTSADDLTINNLKIHTTGENAHGIWVAGTPNSGTAVTGLTVQDDTIVVDGYSAGIYAEQVSTTPHLGWLIGGAEHGNTIIVSTGDGMDLIDVSASEVSYNDITVTDPTGDPRGSTNVLWTSELSNLSTLVFDNNTVSGSSGSEVAFLTDFIEYATGNLIPPDTNVTGVTVSNNTFSDWGSRALRFATANGGSGTVTGVAVSTNKFLVASVPETLKNESAAEIDAVQNWWGQDTGPASGAVTGGGSVDYRPWCTNGDCDPVDTTVPVVTVDTLITNDTTPTITGTIVEANAVTVAVTVNGHDYAAVVTDGTWSAGVTDVLTEGTYNVIATAEDNAGNIATDSTNNELAIDTIAPTASLSGAPVGTTNSTSAEITVAGASVTAYKYDLDDAGYGAETPVATHITLSGLSDGGHTVSVIGRDEAGNYQSVSTDATWTVDATAPAAPTITSIGGDGNQINNSEKAAIAVVGTAEADATVNITLSDAGSAHTVLGSGTVTGGAYSITIDGTILADGTVTASVTATDAADNESGAATDTATKDVVAPTVDSHTPGINAVNVEGNTVTIVFSEPVAVTTGDVAFDPVISFSVGGSGTDTIVLTTNPLSSNTVYTITVATSVKDLAGNSLTESYSWSFTTATLYNISLDSGAGGWNLISLPVVPNDNGISSVLGDAESNIQAVWTYDPADSNAVDGWLVYVPGNPDGTNNLDTMTAGYGYWVSVTSSTSISGAGSLLSVGPTLPPSRGLSAGWNLIGYYQIPGENSSTKAEALASVGTAGVDYTSLWGFNNSTGQFKSSVDPINPGDAFWVSLPSAKTYTPSNL